jgi:hypothetical protein
MGIPFSPTREFAAKAMCCVPLIVEILSINGRHATPFRRHIPDVLVSKQIAAFGCIPKFPATNPIPAQI